MTFEAPAPPAAFGVVAGITAGSEDHFFGSVESQLEGGRERGGGPALDEGTEEEREEAEEGEPILEKTLTPPPPPPVPIPVVISLPDHPILLNRLSNSPCAFPLFFSSFSSSNFGCTGFGLETMTRKFGTILKLPRYEGIKKGANESSNTDALEADETDGTEEEDGVIVVVTAGVDGAACCGVAVASVTKTSGGNGGAVIRYAVFTAGGTKE